MASPASRKRNTARMDGNAAYDLRSTAAEEYLYSTAPVDLPHAPRPTETVVPESAPRPKQAIAPMAVLGFAIAAVLIVFSLVARVQLSRMVAAAKPPRAMIRHVASTISMRRCSWSTCFGTCCPPNASL